MLKVHLIRASRTDKVVVGMMLVSDDNGVKFTAMTVENAEKLLAAGTYPLVFEYSPKFQRKLWEVKNVPGRSEIKIHVANRFDQLRGCIAPGLEHRDINGDGHIDVTNSTITIERFHKVMSKQVVSEIIVSEV